MYKSPIEVLVTDIEHQIVKQQDEEIYKAVLNYIPNIDREELLRALQYDREQYEKGYADGKADLVRCKNCKYSQWYEDYNVQLCHNSKGLFASVTDDDYCSHGERTEDDR